MSATWLAAVLTLPDQQGKAFLVLDRDTGDLRLTRIVTPDDDVGSWLLHAADAPDAGAPARPKRVLTDARTAPSLRKAARKLGTKLKVQSQLPAFDRLVAELGDALREPPPPVAEPARWRSTLALLQARPWSGLPHPQVAFVLHGADVLHGRVVELVGIRGDGGCGVLVHDDMDELVRFGSLGEHQVQRVPMSVQLVPSAELSEEHQRFYEDLGLAAHGEALLVSRGLSTLLPLDEADEPLARAAVQAVAAALAEHGDAVCAGETRTVVQTEVGPLVVQGLAVPQR